MRRVLACRGASFTGFSPLTEARPAFAEIRETLDDGAIILSLSTQ
ncbi:hypothetical protein [Undibacterium sp. Jales W-56]|nr:hypothetical protein [Undibacterium sp. Jales W-56]